MKKKAIEKIPYQTAEKTKKKYTYVAAVSIQEICGISHLFVEIYENKKKSLLIPHIRMAFTKHDWAFYYPSDEWWRVSDIDLLCIDQKKTYISEKAMDKIWNFVKERGWGPRNNNSWINTLNCLVGRIKKERREKQRETRQEQLNNRIANLPTEPADLKKWVDTRLFNNAHRLYYKRHGRYADLYCTSCKKDCTKATQSGESFEDQFESVISTPREGQQGICPLCHATGIYKAKGRKKLDSPEMLKEYFFIAQPYGKTGAVLRYYLAEKGFDLIANKQSEEAREEVVITEISREFFEKGKKIQRDFHVHDNWNGENIWIDCNIQGTYHIKILNGAIYPQSYENLKDTILQYSGAEKFSLKYPSYNLFRYMEAYNKYPQVEILSKLGLHKTVIALMEDTEKIVDDATATNPTKFFGIYPERVSELIKRKGDTSYLKAYQAEKKVNKRFSDRQIEAVRVCNLAEYLDTEFFTYAGLDRLINNLERYAECEAVDGICSRALAHLRAITRRYFDYIRMRKEAGYDLHNSIYLFPRDLNIAHGEMVEEINKDKIKERNAEISLRYPEIKRNYQKLCYRYSCKVGDYLIRPARDAAEITREGRYLHHCVGSDNYLSKHNKGDSYILFLRKQTEPEKPYVTIEIKGERIVQWYGAYDKKPDATIIAELLRQYTRELKARAEQQTLAAAV